MGKRYFKVCYYNENNKTVSVGVINMSDSYCDSVERSIRSIARTLNLDLEMEIIHSCFYNKTLMNPDLAFLDPNDIIDNLRPGYEVDMSFLDEVAREYALNEEYSEYLFKRLNGSNGTYAITETDIRIINYISDKAIQYLDYYKERATENFEKYKANKAANS